jgi:hypothetical protein
VVVHMVSSSIARWLLRGHAPASLCAHPSPHQRARRFALQALLDRVQSVTASECSTIVNECMPATTKAAALALRGSASGASLRPMPREFDDLAGDLGGSMLNIQCVPECSLLPCAVVVSVLCCAVLCCAVLCCAVLCCAVLCCAVLCCAVLCCAVLCCACACAVLCCAVLRSL